MSYAALQAAVILPVVVIGLCLWTLAFRALRLAQALGHLDRLAALMPASRGWRNGWGLARRAVALVADHDAAAAVVPTLAFGYYGVSAAMRTVAAVEGVPLSHPDIVWVTYVFAATLTLSAVVLASLLGPGLRLLDGVAQAPREIAEADERTRRAHAALQSAVADENVAILAWDEHGRWSMAEGGLFDFTRRPTLGDDAEGAFRAWGRDASLAWDHVARGETPPPYDVEDPSNGMTYHVRARPNRVEGAGYALVTDVTDERAERAELARLREVAEDRLRQTQGQSAEDILRDALRREGATNER